MPKVDLAVLNKAVATATRQIGAAQHKVDRNKAKDAIKASVASALGVAVNQAQKKKVKRKQFIDDGQRIMRGGYRQAFTSGANDAWDDFGYGPDDINQDTVDSTDQSDDPAWRNWALAAGMIDDSDYMDNQMSGINDNVDKHSDFLSGLFDAVLAIGIGKLASDILGGRLDLYGNSAATTYEQGYAGVAKKGGRVPTWHTSGDDGVCDLCAAREGDEYQSVDDVDVWPGDGDFGEACDGGPNCRCYFTWDEAEKDDGDVQDVDIPDEISAFFTADLIKVENDRWFWPVVTKADLFKGDVAGHEFHGNRYTGGIGGADISDAAIGRIVKSLYKFSRAGGSVKIYHANNDDERKELDAIVEDHEHYNVNIDRDIRGSLSDGMFDSTSAVAVAFNKQGEIVGATGFGVGPSHWDENGNRLPPDKEGVLQHEIYSTDSNLTLPGTGTALVTAIAHEAASQGSRVSSLYIDTARTWHEYIGRNLSGGLDGGSSKWSAADVQKIAANTVAPKVLSDGLIPDYPGRKMFKGEGAGHAFRGNRYTGGIPGEGKDETVHRVKSISEAIERLSRGEKVELSQPRQVSTLVDRLGKIVNDARAKGEAPPNINLCNVSVPGTNLFCADNVGYTRVQMPQLAARPIPGSFADGFPKDAEGVVNMADHYKSWLASQGVKIYNTNEDAEMLRASQNELNGAKVANIARNYDIIPPARLFVSSDNYVVDGHHRWAAAVSNSLRDTGSGNVRLKVSRVNMPISRLLELTNKYCDMVGLPRENAAALVKLLKGESAGHEFRGNRYTGGIPGNPMAREAYNYAMGGITGKEQDLHDRIDTIRQMTRHSSPEIREASEEGIQHAYAEFIRRFGDNGTEGEQYGAPTSRHVDEEGVYHDPSQEFHGGVTPQVKLDVIGSIDKFKANGGRIEQYEAGSASARDLADEFRTQMAQKVEDGEVDGEDKDTVFDDPNYRGINFTQYALDGTSAGRTNALVARDTNGDIVGAINYEDHGDRLHVGHLGSTNTIPGTGTTLTAALADMASRNGQWVESEMIDSARTFHERIGRETNAYGESRWNVEDASAIGNLYSRRMHTADKLFKGDVTGHEFHGNRYTGGIPSGLMEEGRHSAFTDYMLEGGVTEARQKFIQAGMQRFKADGGRIIANPSMEELARWDADVRGRRSTDTGIEYVQSVVGTAYRSALRGVDPGPRLFAVDKDGNIAGAISYRIQATDYEEAGHAQGFEDTAHIGVLGSMHTIGGVGSALTGAVASVADAKGLSVESETDGTQKAGNFHEAIGRRLSTNYSDHSVWDRGDVEVVARTFATVFGVPSSGDQLELPGIKKGDVAGHEFHGNRYTGGIGGGRSVAERTKAPKVDSLDTVDWIERRMQDAVNEAHDNPLIQHVCDKFGTPNVGTIPLCNAPDVGSNETVQAEYFEPPSYSLDGLGRIVLYNRDMPVPATKTASEPNSGGMWLVGRSAADVYRHELGHFVEDRVSQQARGLYTKHGGAQAGADKLMQWNDLWSAYKRAGAGVVRSPSKDPANAVGVTRRMSGYSLRSSNEGFAEVFAYVTHPAMNDAATAARLDARYTPKVRAMIDYMRDLIK